MAIPKRRKSGSARDKRRSHHKVTGVNLVPGPAGELVPHAFAGGLKKKAEKEAAKLAKKSAPKKESSDKKTSKKKEKAKK